MYADAMPSNIEAAGRGFHEKILIKTGAFRVARRYGALRNVFFLHPRESCRRRRPDSPHPTTPCPPVRSPTSTRPRFTRHPPTAPPSPARTPHHHRD